MNCTTDGPAPMHDEPPVVDIYPDDDMVLAITQELRSRVEPTPNLRLEHHVRTMLNELAPIRITVYLGVLVEHRLRSRGLVTLRRGGHGPRIPEPLRREPLAVRPGFPTGT
jgi:hypothetical protein